MIPGPNWARRYGNNSRRLCARPGCGTAAAATLRFQPTQREAWLVDLDDNAARTEGDLCARHASGLVLPRGWELHDERTHIAPATAPPAPAPRRVTTRGASVARARKRRTQRDDPQLPDLVAVPEPEREPEPVVEVVDVEVEIDLDVDVIETAAVEPDPPRPALEKEFSEPAREELNDALDAQTPLLRRAFQNVWPFEDE
ncbi:MAG TPA: DUF3499 family protein [Acidimicrobiia bacterium]|nr:DUF3499 family protein [Acidimicrobiia bacterium]